MSIEKIVVNEKDVIKIILEFLSSRNYHVSMRTLEKESCIVNCNLTNEMLYIRELILDGDFEELLQLSSSLSTKLQFDDKRFKYLILRQKFIELIYMRSHIMDKEQKIGVADVIKTLSRIEIYCPSKEDYNNLCWLLTVPNLHAHESFRDWTLDMSRLKCFDDLMECFEENPNFIKSDFNTSDSDRLLQLLVKGLFYELCTEYCQSVASGDIPRLEKHANVLHNTGDSSPTNLFCWVQSLPFDIFQNPFEQFNVDVQFSNSKGESLEKLTFDRDGSEPYDDVLIKKPLQFPSTEYLAKQISTEKEEMKHSVTSSTNKTTEHLTKSANFEKCVSVRSGENVSKSLSTMEIPKVPSSNADTQQVFKSMKDNVSFMTESSDLYHSTPVTTFDTKHVKTMTRGLQQQQEENEKERKNEKTEATQLATKENNYPQSSKAQTEQISLEAYQPDSFSKIEESVTFPSPDQKPSLPSTEQKLVDTQKPSVTANVRTSQDSTATDSSQEKENVPGDDNVVLGPVINGVRRPISEKYLGANHGFLAKKTQGANGSVLSKLEPSPPRRKPKEENGEELSTSYSRHISHTYQRRSSDVELQFCPVEILQDSQAVRSVAFHPGGSLYAVGANSKTLRICKMSNSHHQLHRDEKVSMQVVFKRAKYHRGSIYCMEWSDDGCLLASGSNDKSIKLLEFDPENYTQINNDIELNIHSGTIRELAFVPNKPGLLVSGGAGDGSIKVTDVFTEKVVGSLTGHSGNVFTVYAGENNLVASGGADNTLRLWDLRSERCIDVVMVGDSSPASAALNSKFIASGQDDGSILVYDITAGRTIQNFRLHQQDCRSVRFSPDSNYLLTSSYDKTVSIMHMQKCIYENMPMHYVVAQHDDKVIQCRWHPAENMFLSSSADKTAMLWKTY